MDGQCHGEIPHTSQHVHKLESTHTLLAQGLLNTDLGDFYKWCFTCSVTACDHKESRTWEGRGLLPYLSIGPSPLVLLPAPSSSLLAPTVNTPKLSGANSKLPCFLLLPSLHTSTPGCLYPIIHLQPHCCKRFLCSF